jgi:2-hydroxy-6-oxonona-2,4-dienedioate hydrolase
MSEIATSPNLVGRKTATTVHVLASNSILSRLEARRTGNGVAFRSLGSGRPLLLVHGASGSWLHWWRNIVSLAETHRVIALDMPGYGDSDDVSQNISLEAYVSIVKYAALEVADDAPLIDIVAFSFGGLIGSGVAASLGARARRALILAPSGFERPIARALGRRPRSMFPESEQGEQEYLRYNLLVMMLHEPDSVDEVAIAIQRWNLAHARFRNQHLSFSNRLPGFLANIACPLMIAYGEYDRTPHPSRDARLAICREAAPNLATEVIPGAGHWLQFEQPVATNALIEGFLK